MTALLIFFVVFIAIFTQSLSGFGLALISMPLLAELVGVQVAAPLVALIGLVTEVVLIIRYRMALKFAALWRLSMASLVGIPLGVWALPHINEQLALKLLALLIVSYAFYALLNLKLPSLQQPNWAYGFGFAGGLMSGAYNTSGPAIVIYGSCRRWPPAEFKSNLQGFFLLNSTVVIASHAASHHFTAYVWQYALIALPAIALGAWAGFAADRYVEPEAFRKVVLLLLLLLGSKLLFS